MSKYEKILIVILFGSIMGAIELFGGDFMGTLDISNKSAYLFALGLMLMIASKLLIDFKGSIIIMVAIAAIYKTASANFYACQVAAVMINGVIFETSYLYLRNKIDSSLIWRSISAPIVAYISYTFFALAAVYILKEAHWAARGFDGIVEYLGSSAAIAGFVSIFTFNIGLFLGHRLRRILASDKPRLSLIYFRAVSIMIVIIIWFTGLES
jgi:hypothetical protein